MTFEENYCNLLQDALYEELKVETLDHESGDVISTDYTDVKITNNLTYEPLQYNANEIRGILRGGNASNIGVPGIDLNAMTMTVTMYLDANKVNTFLTAAANVAKDENAGYQTLLIDGVEYIYRSVFNTPYVIGAPYEHRTPNSTIKIINAVWVITVNYSTNALAEPPADQVIIDGTTYDINYIARVEKSVNPNYDVAQKINTDIATHRKINITRAYVYSLRKVTSDTLQTRLVNELNAKSNASTISLKVKDGTTYTTIPIQTYNISEVWENGVAAITFTLTR